MCSTEWLTVDVVTDVHLLPSVAQPTGFAMVAPGLVIEPPAGIVDPGVSSVTVTVPSMCCCVAHEMYRSTGRSCTWLGVK